MSIEVNEFSEIIKSYGESFEQLKRYKQHAESKMSYYDTMLSDYYHLFEFGKFPAHILSQIHKKFVECLHMRRKYKSELHKIQSIENKLKANGINKIFEEGACENLKYTPRVLVDEFKEYAQYLNKNQQKISIQLK